MGEVPTFATHYHLRGRRPFQNLTEVPDDELPAVLKGLDGTSHRRFGPRYLDLRRRTEAKLRDLFVAAGGRPERTSPHYLVLGTSPWFSGLADDMAEIRVPLARLPADLTSLTFPDSFEAMALGPEYGLPYEPRPSHERVFGLTDLDELVAHARPGGHDPADPAEVDYSDYADPAYAQYIEVQVWSDDPLRGHLDG